MLPEEMEPKPPKKYLKRADHHWLDVYTSDGHFMDIRVLQWAPGAQRWCYSGNVGTGMYVDTKFWRYVDHCPMPELKEKI